MTGFFSTHEECNRCRKKHELTDVEGHYSGICKSCRDHDKESFEASEKRRLERIASGFGEHYFDQG